MQGVRWRPHLFLMQAVLHRVSHFEEKKMLLCSFKTESPLLKTLAGLKRHYGQVTCTSAQNRVPGKPWTGFPRRSARG
jgi:hypothetical protein